MKYIGYHRTSTIEQKLERGITEITQYCEGQGIKLFKNKVYTDQATGKNFNRPGYLLVKELLEEGDTLIITEVDRLGRSKSSTLKELQYFRENNIRVMILELPTTLLDYSSLPNNLAKMILETVNNLLIEMYAAMSEAEMLKREKRQREGIEAMKLNGNWNEYGRPPIMSKKEFAKHYQRVLNNEIRPFELIEELNMKVPTYYKYKRVYEQSIDDSSNNKLESQITSRPKTY